MLKDIEVAKFFLAKDPNRNLFNKMLVRRNGRDFYEGNARLNKYLHLAQNLYIAKEGKKLFADDLYAYDNGAVAPNVQENFSILSAKNDVPNLDKPVQDFLNRVYRILEHASLDELIELSHEDPEWVKKHGYYYKVDQKMDSIANAAEYKKQYQDVLKVMDRIEI